MLVDLDRTAGLKIDALRPVDGHELIRAQQLASFAVDHIGKSVTIEVNERLMWLSIDVREIHQNVLVDAVIVPLVERCHLVVPGNASVFHVTGEDGHRPLIVPLTGVTAFLRWRILAAGGVGSGLQLPGLPFDS